MTLHDAYQLKQALIELSVFPDIYCYAGNPDNFEIFQVYFAAFKYRSQVHRVTASDSVFLLVTTLKHIGPFFIRHILCPATGARAPANYVDTSNFYS